MVCELHLDAHEEAPSVRVSQENLEGTDEPLHLGDFPRGIAMTSLFITSDLKKLPTEEVLEKEEERHTDESSASNSIPSDNSLPASEKSNRFTLYVFAFLISMNGSVGSMCVTGLNPLTSTLKNVYEWSEAETTQYISMLNAITLLGGFLGTLTANRWLSVFGRLSMTIICDLAFIGLGSVVSASVVSIIALAAGRFLVGYGTSLLVYIAVPFLREISPSAVRGLLGAFYQLHLALGILAGFCVALGLPEPTEESRSNNYWRVCLLAPSVLGLVQVVGFLLFFRGMESPKVLFERGQNEKAKQVLERIHLPREAEENLKSLQLGVARNEESSRPKKSLKDAAVYRPLLLAMFIMFVFHTTGITSLLIYSTDIFNSSSADPTLHESIMNSLIYFGVVGVVGAIVGLYTAGTFKRRPLVYTSLVTLVLCSFAIFYFDSQGESEGVKFSVLFFTLAVQAGIGSIVFPYQAEILEPELFVYPRCIHWICLITVSLVTKPAISGLGLANLYLIYGLISLVFLIVLSRVMIETRGLKAEEIRAKFESKMNVLPVPIQGIPL